MAFAKYPPENISEAITVLKQDVELTHGIVHGDESTEVLTENGLVPSFSKVINTFEVQGQQVISEFGWTPVGTFAAGFTFTSPNQVGQDAEGNWWRWNGALPKTVTAGTLPSSDANYKLASDGVLRSDLNNGAALINGEPASELLNLKSSAPIDFSTICGDEKTVVITGDSLSFNAYDFPVPLNPTDYADGENSSGLMSWSHMLRDKIHRQDGNFVHSSEFGVSVSAGDATYSYNAGADTLKYFFPFNNNLLEINGKNSTDSVRVVIPRNFDSSIVRLHCVSAGASFSDRAGLVDLWAFTVSGTFISKITITTGGRTKYFGLEPFFADFGDSFPKDSPIYIEFRNFRKTDGSEPDAAGVSILLSAAQTNRVNVKLTGRGGYTTANILSDISRLITSHLPDVLLLIAGANDRALEVSSSTVISNLTAIVAATRVIKPQVKIVFMSTTPASNAGFGPDEILNGETMTEWLLNIKTAMLALGCEYFDTYNLFLGLPPAQWRFDNIHWNKNGGKIMLDNVVSRFFAASTDRFSYLSNPQPSFQWADGYKNPLAEKLKSGWLECQYDDATNTYAVLSKNDRDGVVFSVTKGADDYDLIVNANFNLSEFNYSITVEPVSSFGAVQPVVTTAGYNGNSARFTLFNLLGSPIAAITDAQNDDKQYLIRWG